MDTIYIYCLLDPRNNSVRYVGKTKNTKQRQMYHNSAGSLLHGTRRWKWITELRSLGFRPRLEILEECTPENWSDRERFWIHRYGGIRKLLNARLGGEIIPPRTEESYRIEADKRRGIPRPPEVGQKVSATLMGHAVSDGSKEKIREANRIQFSDPEKREKHRLAMIDWWNNLTEEQKQRSKEGAAKASKLRWERYRENKK